MLTGVFNSIISLGFRAYAKTENQHQSGFLSTVFNHVAEVVEKVINFHKSIFFGKRAEGSEGRPHSRFYDAVHEYLHEDEKEDKSKSPRALELLALLKQVALAVAREEYPMTIGALQPILAELESLGVYGADMILANAVPMHKNTPHKFVYHPAAQDHHHYGMRLAA